MIDPAVFRAMVANGATPEMLLAVVEAAAAVEEQKKAKKRADAAVRQQRFRDKNKGQEGHEVTQNNASNALQGVTECDSVTAPPSPSPLPSPCTPNQPPAPTHPVYISRVREDDRVSEAVDLWNAMASRTGLSRVSKLTEDRRKKIRARLADASWEQFTEAIAAVERSPFCRGDSTDGWRADFDFLLQPKSFNRLIEGSYDRASSRNGTSQRMGGNGGSGGSSGGRSTPLDAAERWLARRAAQ